MMRDYREATKAETYKYCIASWILADFHTMHLACTSTPINQFVFL